MENRPPETVFINILDKDYQVSCPPNEREALLLTARELDLRMRATRNTSHIIGIERIAVMTALNLCHELLQSKQQNRRHDLDKAQLRHLSDKLDSAIDQLS